MSTAEEDAGAAAQDGYLSPLHLQLARLSVKAQLYTRVKKQPNQLHHMVLFEFLLYPIIFEKGTSEFGQYREVKLESEW